MKIKIKGNETEVELLYIIIFIIPKIIILILFILFALDMGGYIDVKSFVYGNYDQLLQSFKVIFT